MTNLINFIRQLIPHRIVYNTIIIDNTHTLKVIDDGDTTYFSYYSGENPLNTVTINNSNHNYWVEIVKTLKMYVAVQFQYDEKEMARLALETLGIENKPPKTETEQAFDGLRRARKRQENTNTSTTYRDGCLKTITEKDEEDVTEFLK